MPIVARTDQSFCFHIASFKRL